MANAQAASSKGAHFFARKWAFLGVATLAVAVVLAVNMLHAATGMTINSVLTGSQSAIGHQYVALFTINVGTPASGETMNSIAVQVNAQTGNGATVDANAATSSVLEDLGAWGGGLSVWKASSSTATVFDPLSDLQFLVSSTNYTSNGSVTVNLNPTPSLSANDKFYLVARVDDMGLTNNAAVTFTLPSNAVTTSVGAQTSNTLTTGPLTVSANDPKIVTVKYLNTSTPLVQGSQIVIKFNQEMQNTSWAANNLNSNFYCYNTTNYTQGSFGTSPDVSWSTTQSSNDTATITLGSNPTLQNGMKCSPYAQSKTGKSLNDPFFIDTTKPFLKSVTVIKTGNGHFISKEDKALLQFGGPAINESTLNGDNTDTALLLSGGQSWASKPRLNWVTPNVAILTLAGDQPSNLDGTITMDPAGTVKSQSGFADNTVTPPTILLRQLDKPMLTTLAGADNDVSVSYGIDKNDLTVTHQMGTTTDSVPHYAHFFVLPLDGKTTFDPTIDYHFNSGGVPTSATAPQTYNASSSTYSIYADSRYNYGTNSGDYNNLMSGVPYVIFGATSTVQNPSNQNDYGAFTFSSAFYFTSENTIDYTKPEVTAVSPSNGSKDIGTNLQAVTVQFSEEMDQTKLTNSNITLAYDSDGNGSYETSASITKLTYSTGNKLLVVQPSSLVASKKYQLTFSTGLTDSSGNSLANNYNTVFTTAASTTTPVAKINNSTITNNATNVSPTISDVRFTFDQPMDWTKASLAGISINPLATGSLSIDINSNALIYTFTQPLAGSSSYTITITPSSSAYLNAYGVQLDGDGNGSAGGNYTLSFQTGSLDTVAPSITSADATDSKLEVVFDKDMSSSDVTNKDNWTITCNYQSATTTNYGSTYGYTGTSTGYTFDTSSTSSTVSLSSASFSYSEKKLTMTSLYLAKDSSCTITASNNVRSAAGTAISSTGKSKTTTVHSDYSASYSSSYTYGSSTYDTYKAYYSSPSVWLTNSQASATSSAGFFIPMNGVALPTGSKLKLTFPSGFGLSSVTMGTDYNSTDMNGSGSGTVTATVSADNTTKVVTLTLSGSVGSTDNLNFTLNNVVNPSTAAEIDYTNYDSTTGTYTGGYQISISAEKSDGTTLFTSVKTSSFSITSAGTGSISGTVKNSSGVGVSGATVKIWGTGGEISATTAANGTYTLSGVSNGTYYPFVDYQGSFVYGTAGVIVSSTAQTVTGIDFTVTTKSDTVNVTVTHSSSLAGKQASVYCWDQLNYENVSKTITLANATSTMATLNVTPGTKTCSLYEAFDYSSGTGGTAGGYNYTSSFAPPASQNVTVTSGISASVTFSLSAADKVISGHVYDQNGTGLVNVSISVFTHNDNSGGDAGMMGGSTWTSTKSDGSFSANVSAAATYVVSASQGGLGYFEKEVVVSSTGTTSPSSVDFKMSKTSSTITGTVLDSNNNPLQYVSILAKGTNTGSTQYSSTDSTGKYTLFVAADTWTVNANAYSTFPTCTTGNSTSCSVTVADNGTGSANFKVDQSKVKTISGTVSVDGTKVQYASVWAQLYDTTTGKEAGFNGAWASTDANGIFSLSVTANSTGQRYRLQAWTYNNGTVGSKDNIDVSTSDATGLALTSNATTVSVSVTNAPSGVNSVSLSSKSNTDTTDVGKWNSITLTSGSGSASFSLPKGTTQKIIMNVPGYGDQTPTSVTGGTLNSNGTVELTGSTATITFNLNSLKTASITVTGTVKSGSTPVPNASVTLTDGMGTYVQTLTSSTGTYSLTAKSGLTYKLFASATGYIGTEAKVTTSGTKDLSLSAANSTITGTLKQNGATTDSGTVWAQSSDGAWAQAAVNADATWTLKVPGSTTFTVYGLTGSGYKGSNTNVASGTANVTVNATTASVTSFASPASTQTTPGSGATLDDRTGATATGFFVGEPGSAYKNSNLDDTTGAGTITAKETVVPESVTGLDAVGSTAIEVKQTDSSGNPITVFSTPVTLNLVENKADITAALATGDVTQSALDNLQMGYFDTATQSWIALPTTETCETQATSSSTFTGVSCSSLVDILKAGTSIPNDYHMILAASTTHFTVFGAVVPADSTAPSAPTGLAAASASSTSVSLSWTANTDTDLLEYEIYRSTTSGFTPSSATQINTSSVTTNSYTDTGLTTGTKYYYRVTAADTSGNESSGSSEANATPTATTTTTTVTGSSSMVGGGTSSSSSSSSTSSSSEETTSSAEESSTESTETTTGATEETAAETGLDYTGHWAESYIQVLVDRGVVSGYADAPEGYTLYYAPDNNLTRAELAKIVVNLFEYVATAVNEMPFVDVDVDQWYAPFVAKLKDLGVVEGYADGTYAPDQAITRAEAMKILLGGAGKDVENYVWESNPFRDVDTSAWYAPYVLYAYDHGYVGGYKDADGNLTGDFGPGNDVTRGEMSKMAVEVAGLAD